MDPQRLLLFHGVAPARVDLLLQDAVMRDVASRTQVVQEGQPAEYLHVAVAGSLEVFA